MIPPYPRGPRGSDRLLNRPSDERQAGARTGRALAYAGCAKNSLGLRHDYGPVPYRSDHSRFESITRHVSGVSGKKRA